MLMGVYSIDQLSKVTGISKRTLRAWETRYGYLSGNRTKTNIRIYNDSHLIRAINTTTLLSLGYKISKIALLLDKEVNQIILKVSDSKSNKNEDVYINALLKACVKYDANLFDLTFSRGILKYGIIDFYIIVILPALTKIGLFWLVNNLTPAQEHFFSELLKERISVETNAFALEEAYDPSWVIFLPEGEHHEIGLLMAKLILRKQNKKVYYFGANLPFDTMNEINTELKPKNVLYFIISNRKVDELENIVFKIEKNFPSSNIYMVSNISLEKKFKNTNIINEITQFTSILN